MYYHATLSEEAGLRPVAEAEISIDDHPAAYRPDPGLVDAVNVALILKRPLLLTGDPGTGKTQLAHSLAWQLARQGALDVHSPRVEKFETKSTSASRDLFYTFDILGRFHAAQVGGPSAGNVDYLTYNALGRALLDTLSREKVAPFLPPNDPHDGPKRSVVLIDEIDKAPRDFPNDLLNEIDQMYFRVPELGNVRVDGDGALVPVVVITSNSEKALPDPFLRRCIFYNIPFRTERLEEILLARLGHLRVARGRLVDDARQFFVHLYENNLARRKISVAELLQWLTFMLSSGARPDQSLTEASKSVLQGISALAKDPEDQEGIAAELRVFTSRLR